MSILNDPAVAAFLERHSDHRKSSGRPLAVFDCDGTVIKGDIGEAMLYYQIEHFLFRASPAALWPDHPRRSELDDLYRALQSTPASRRAEHAAAQPFAEIILSWYFGQIADGRVEKGCTDVVRLLAGFTPAEVRRIAHRTFRQEIQSPLAQRTLGGHVRPSGVRFLKEPTELLAGLRELRFDIWAVSGSNRWSVEPVFKRLGVPLHRVIGIDLKEEGGYLTPQEILPVPIRENKVHALRRRSQTVPVLAVSDSKNDIPLLMYSSDLRIRINSRKRDTDDFFRSGNIRRDEHWVVLENPTIIP